MSSVTNITIYDSGIPQSKVDEIDTLYKTLEPQRLKFIKNNTFIDCVLEAAKVSYGVHEARCFKIKDIILRNELVRDIFSKDSSPAEIEELLKLSLTYDEEKVLRTALEQRIKEKRDTLLEELGILTGTDDQYSDEMIDTIRFDVKSEQQNFISYQKKLIEIRKVYVDAMLEYGEKLRELLQLRTQEMPKVLEEKSQEIYLRSEKSNKKLSLMKQSLKVLISGDMLPTGAYRCALNDLKQQQQQCLQDLERLSQENSKYEEIAQTQDYQNILTDYKQYKKGSEKKKWLYAEVLNKAK